jgi:hypothetical protein
VFETRMGSLARPWEAWCAAALFTIGLGAGACAINPQPLPPNDRGGESPADAGGPSYLDSSFGNDAAQGFDARPDRISPDACSDAAPDASMEDARGDAAEDARDDVDAAPDADEDDADGADGDTF